MTLQKISFDQSIPASAFIVRDFDDSELATGVIRSAKKVLTDGAWTLARSETYAWAVLGRQRSGASVGINSPDDSRSDAIAAFCQQISDQVASNKLALRPAKGVTYDDLAPLLQYGTGERGTSTTTEEQALRALSIGVAAAAATIRELSGATVTVEDGCPATDAVAEELARRGAIIDKVAPTAIATSEGDILVCGSRIGIVDHVVAERIQHRAIVPMGAAPVTARGLAVARRRNITVLADFVTTCGALWTHMGTGVDHNSDIQQTDIQQTDIQQTDIQQTDIQQTDIEQTDIEQAIIGLCGELSTHEDGPYMAACYRAEEFLSTWRDELPFGRPLA